MFDSEGVAIKLRSRWKTSISENNEIVPASIATPIFYDENLLVGSTENSNRSILSLNASDGAINWEWSDLLGSWSDPLIKDPFDIYLENYHFNDGRLFFTYSTSSYCIDVTSGQTAWKYKSFRSRFSRNDGLDYTYFTSGSTYDPIDEEKIYRGDILSSAEEQLLLIPDYSTVPSPPVNAQGHITSMSAFIEDGNHFLAFGVSNPATDFTIDGLGLSELNLYNITSNKYVYKKIVVNPERETFGVSHLIYDGSKLYFQSLNFIHCYDAMTGQQLWRSPVGQPPLLSSMILVNNRIYSASEDRFLYCIDAATGNLLWKEQNTGTCTELSHLNGVLYYLGGGDGLLHAVDAQNGKHLWKVSSPDVSANSGAWFFGVCTAVPGRDGEKGVVVATTGLNAYGYEAIK